MRLKWYLIAPLALMLALSVSCSKKEVADTNEITEVPAEAGKNLTNIEPENTVTLKLNLPVGYSKMARITKDSKCYRYTQTVRWQAHMSSKEDYLIECLDVDPNGLMTIRQTLKAIKLVNTDEEGTYKYEYDSANPQSQTMFKDKTPENPINTSLIMKITPAGKIVDTHGAGVNPAIWQEQLPHAFNFANMAVAVLHIYPGSVQIGQRWSSQGANCIDPEKTTQSGPTGYRWILEGISDGLAQLEMESKTKTTETRDLETMFKINAKPLKFKTATAYTLSKISIDTATGLIKKSTIYGDVLSEANPLPDESLSKDTEARPYIPTAEVTITIQIHLLDE